MIDGMSDLPPAPLLRAEEALRRFRHGEGIAALGELSQLVARLAERPGCEDRLQLVVVFEPPRLGGEVLCIQLAKLRHRFEPLP